jgi:hypothetical protein
MKENMLTKTTLEAFHAAFSVGQKMEYFFSLQIVFKQVKRAHKILYVERK